jgi:hypothetical protein
MTSCHIDEAREKQQRFSKTKTQTERTALGWIDGKLFFTNWVMGG